MDGNRIRDSQFPFFFFNDCYGAPESHDYNLISTTDDCTFSPKANDLVNVSAELDVLADNGGATQTHALKPNSPAIDHGNAGGCVDEQNVVLTTDQRGQPRPVDGDGSGGKRCDPGAYELRP